MFDIESIIMMEKKCRGDLTQHVRNLMVEPRSNKSSLIFSDKSLIPLFRNVISKLYSPSGRELQEHIEAAIHRLLGTEPNHDYCSYAPEDSVTFSFEFNEHDSSFIIWCDSLCGCHFHELSIKEAVSIYKLLLLLKQKTT